MAEAAKTGGPTKYTKQTVPDWDGFYRRNDQQDAPTQWLWGNISQASTILSLLTPEYQKRMVQGAFHEAVTNAPQWNASFCYPEGLLRSYTQFAVQQPVEVMTTPYQVQFLGCIADNFLRRVLIGRQHAQRVDSPRLGFRRTANAHKEQPGHGYGCTHLHRRTRQPG